MVIIPKAIGLPLALNMVKSCQVKLEQYKVDKKVRNSHQKDVRPQKLWGKQSNLSGNPSICPFYLKDLPQNFKVM